MQRPPTQENVAPKPALIYKVAPSAHTLNDVPLHAAHAARRHRSGVADPGAYKPAALREHAVDVRGVGLCVRERIDPVQSAMFLLLVPLCACARTALVHLAANGTDILPGTV